MNVFPDKKTFEQKALLGNLIPIWTEISTHHETPLSAYEAVREFLRSKKIFHSYLLESAEGGDHIGRYSYIGGIPRSIIRGYERRVEVTSNNETYTEFNVNPMDILKSEMGKYIPVKDDNLDSRFIGGAVGFFGYDMISQFEPRISIIDNDDLEIPDMVFMITDGLIIFDNYKKNIIILSHAFINSDFDKAYNQAMLQLELLNEALQSSENNILSIDKDIEPLNPQSNTSKDEYFKMVERAKEYIHAGDIIQVVLSQRFEVENESDSLDIYKALRVINPSPYMFCLDLGDNSIVGTSPEIHVRCHDNNVEVRPIAGTRPRGKDSDEDIRFEEELLSDPKECAEHIMLVDLGRNDIGRVCDYNSVKIPDFMIIERYSHVMHIVSDVVGRLNSEYDAYDVMHATFPAGTVSGAPKVRAMEIISELENSKRGPYAGAVAYFGFDGNFDSAITIRTVILDQNKAYVQAGAGIVADSIALNEYKETQNKAKGMMKALAVAQNYHKNKKDFLK